MSKQAALKIPEQETRKPQIPRQVDVPDDGPREEFEFVDDPGSEEEPGYGHGV